MMRHERTMSAHTFLFHTSRRFLWAPCERYSTAEPPENATGLGRPVAVIHLLDDVQRDKRQSAPESNSHGRRRTFVHSLAVPGSHSRVSGHGGCPNSDSPALDALHMTVKIMCRIGPIMSCQHGRVEVPLKIFLASPVFHR